jgi:two-component system, OmpR family, response regulator
VARQLTIAQPDLVVLDLRLRQGDGLDWLRQIRARSDVPGIITCGYQREESDRVVGLELGADDYLSKPFGPREPVARIRAVLRRQGYRQHLSHHDDERCRCRFSDWELDRRARRLKDPNGSAIALTRGEYTLPKVFDLPVEHL